MNGGMFPVLAAGVGAIAALYIIVILALLILQVVAYWKVFEKAGEPGWKALIPVYSDYILYKIAWDTKVFWFLLGAAILHLLLLGIPVISTVIGFIIGILAIIIEILVYVKLSRAFGHGGGFAVGLIFLTPIFMMILGFEQSEYLGPQE